MLRKWFHQAAGHHRRGADEVHAAGVAVPAVLDDGDVDIDDVAILEHLPFAGDAVADDVVDRGAHGLREAAVADVGRNGALHVHDVVVADAVQFLGGDTGLDVGVTMSSTSLARRPAMRIISISCGVFRFTLMAPIIADPAAI
jgi:hypothetical protein